MTAPDFRTRIRALGLTVGRFADLTGLHPVTVRNWGRTRSQRRVQEVPAWVPLLLSAWETMLELIPAPTPQDRRTAARPPRAPHRCARVPKRRPEPT